MSDLKSYIRKTGALVLLLFIFYNGLFAAGAACEGATDSKDAESLETGTRQDAKKVSGIVRDVKGEAIVGVNVVEKGTTNGTVTDQNGRFSLSVKEGATLQFSFVGYVSQEIPVGNKVNFDVQIEERTEALDEVIVVGYGVQKRRDIVGAIEQVSGEIFENRSNPNVVRSLQGEIPGLTITMVDGKPTRSAEIQIRGAVNSIGSGGNALILIDGVEGDLTTVNPNDVESISVLKDASSTAVYGARGSFGVVLITTKKAVAGKPKIQYSGSTSVLSRTVKPEIVNNGLQWTNTFYESYYNYRGQAPSTINNVFNKWAVSWSDWYNELVVRDADRSLDRVRVNAKGYYDYFGNTDWHDVIYRDYTTANQHNINISGGSDISTYFVSGSFYQQGGIYNAGNEDFKRYSLRAKGRVMLRPWLKLENNTDFFRRKYHEPIVMYSNSSTDYTQIFPIQRQLEQQAYPMTLERNPDGTWTECATYIGWAGFVEGTSFREDSKFDLRNTTTVTVDFFKDILVGKADFTYFYNQSNRNQVGNLYTGYVSPTVPVVHQTFSYLENRTYNNEYIAANATLTYTPKLGENHALTALGGWNLEDKTYLTTLVNRRGLMVPDKPNFSLLDGTDFNIKDNGSYSWGFVGTFYRLNYSYKSRYLAEVSGRYDGTSKFPSQQKWGFFPSGSVGWRVSEEGFLKSARDKWLDNLKVRVSAGTSGNGLISPYKYLSTMAVSKSTVIINGTSSAYTTAPTPIPSGLTWEKASTIDLGVDVDLFISRFNAVFDVYKRYTTDMYVAGEELPAVYGNDAPYGNYADMRTDGWEFSMGWRDRVKVAGKDLSYNLKFAIWNSDTYVTRYTSTTNTLPTIYSLKYYEGMKIGEIWGYRVAGFFQNSEDVANSPSQSQFTNYNGAGNVWQAGDVKFKNLNDDNKITNGSNTLADHGDLDIIGNMTPRYCYSFNLSANWNRIGFSMFWQGVGKRDWYPAKESSYFWGQYGRPYGFALPWHNPENQAGIDANGNITNGDAYWPRLRSYIAEVGAGTIANPTDKYLQDASYLRLKTITVDYTFPVRIANAIGLQDLKIYLSGENLLTFTPLKKWARNFDPEVIEAGDSDYWNTPGGAGDGYSYPMMKSFTFGINVTF
jgi:TonB-linked SusC/RagA family outer membrane protein